MMSTGVQVLYLFARVIFMIGLTTHKMAALQVVLVVKNPLANAGDVRDSGLIPGSGRSPGEGNGNPLQYYCLENPMDRGAWRATVDRVTKSRTWLKWLNTHARWQLRCQALSTDTIVSRERGETVCPVALSGESENFLRSPYLTS